MKQVKCISPHGGCHNGMRQDGNPVHRLRDGSLPEVEPERLRLQPNEGGWIQNVRIPGGYAAVGQVYDVDDEFYADGFHFEDVPEPEPAAPAAPKE